ncbi:MAG: class I SAM-dependent methyltransferase [Pseudonocardia sp.]|nr:class I SAM-dependent methyltransferase [Pseudonocardia sp.]
MVDTAPVVHPFPPPEAELPADDPSARLLGAAVARHGRTPVAWAAGPLLDARRVLDLGCGAGALSEELAPGRWVGVDVSSDTGRPLLRGAPSAIPLRSNAVDAVCLLLTLPRLRDVDDVFAELRRVLRPGGTLVALGPSASFRTLTELRFAPLVVPLHRTGWRNRSALDQAGWLLAAADFAVLGDDRVPFTLPLPDGDAARSLVDDLPRAGLWPPDLSPLVRARLVEGLTKRAGPGAVLPVPMRRLVARR